MGVSACQEAGGGACTYAGVGQVGCTINCTTWLRYDYSIKHELGHNMGFNHASSDINDDGGMGVGQGRDQYVYWQPFTFPPSTHHVVELHPPLLNAGNVVYMRVRVCVCDMRVRARMQW